MIKKIMVIGTSVFPILFALIVFSLKLSEDIYLMLCYAIAVIWGGVFSFFSAKIRNAVKIKYQPHDKILKSAFKTKKFLHNKSDTILEEKLSIVLTMWKCLPFLMFEPFIIFVWRMIINSN